MSEDQLLSYRLTSLEEPADEMLRAIMEKIAATARESTIKSFLSCHSEQSEESRPRLRSFACLFPLCIFEK